MKKSILFVCAVLATCSLAALGIANLGDHNARSNPVSTVGTFMLVGNAGSLCTPVKKETDFFYAIGSRFGGITKSELISASSAIDFLPPEHTQRIVSYDKTSIILIENDVQTQFRELSNSGILTSAQINMLRGFDYSTNFVIKADYVEKDKETGQLKYGMSTPHMTVIPEKEAIYKPGKEALVEYLKEQNKENVFNLDEDELRPAKLYFTVTRSGKIANIRIDRSCGYTNIDQQMIQSIKNLPGHWVPAENNDGESVDQELVVSYGMVGC